MKCKSGSWAVTSDPHFYVTIYAMKCKSGSWCSVKAQATQASDSPVNPTSQSHATQALVDAAFCAQATHVCTERAAMPLENVLAGHDERLICHHKSMTSTRRK